MASARRAASICAVRASSLCMRPISLLTRLSAAANTCLRRRGCSAVPGKLSPLGPFTARFTSLPARQGTLLIAHLAQTLAQRPEVIKRSVIDLGMVTAQDDLMLVIAENAALEFAGYGHGGPLVSCAAANENWDYVHSRRINTAASEFWWQDVPWLSTRTRLGGTNR